MTIKSTDHAALNTVFAEKVAGWKWKGGAQGAWFDSTEYGDARVQIGNTDIALIGLNFTRSADAVLPWLDGQSWQANRHKGGMVSVVLHRNTRDCPYPAKATAPTFPHAAVIALLRAHGIEVE